MQRRGRAPMNLISRDAIPQELAHCLIDQFEDRARKLNWKLSVENHRRMKKNLLGVLLAITCLAAATQLAFAHAVLISSTPKVHGSVHGPSIDVDLKFNSRVDGARSSLSLVMPSGAVQSLALQKQGAPNELGAHAQLGPGKYTLRWTALATDGHITRGEVPFTVE